MWLSILAFCQTCYEFIQSVFDDMKDAVRAYIGPGTSNYILLSNMDVLRESTLRSFVWDSSAFLYTTNDKRIRPFLTLASPKDSPYRRLPWVSVTHTYGQTTTDLSECLSEIRTQCAVPLLQCVRLAAHIQNMHLVETCGATIHVMERGGQEKVFEYTEGVELKEKQ